MFKNIDCHQSNLLIFFLIADRMTALLPEESKQQAVNFLPTKDFEVAYRLDCRNLCADFQEDIQFRFSLGITSLMNRFLGSKGTQHVLLGYSDMVCSYTYLSCKSKLSHESGQISRNSLEIFANCPTYYLHVYLFNSL